MIPRYSRSDMVSVWKPANKFRIWYLIEAHATQAQADLGTVPQRAAEAVWKVRERMEARDIDVAAIDEIEAEVKHDVIAFLTWLAGLVGEDSRFVHQGMTSSDVLDTTLAVQLKEAGALLLAGSERLLAALKTRAHELKDVPTIGRSHAIHAEPTTFGLKLAGHYALIHRCHDRLAQAIDEVSTCAISGAVGTFANIDPAVEVQVADALGLHVEPHSTQVIPRDRHAHFFNACALMASAIENLAVEIRHLQRSEVREAEEFFSAGQKGSSAMPHKRNPVLTENLTGLARFVRAQALPAMENVALWHERDISHSSVERMIAPDVTITLDFALHRLAGVIEKLVVYPERMMANIEGMGGLVHSQRILLALTQAGMSREDAYRVVQTNAMAVWHEGGQLLDRLLADPQVVEALGEEALRGFFDLGYHLKHVDMIFARVFAQVDGGD